MASPPYFRNDAWKANENLKNDLTKYVQQMLKREEILSFMGRDFPEYSWSIRSLDRRLRHFEIYYCDHNVAVEDLKETSAKELEGPGKLLGYRAMQKKVRQQYDLKVPRDLVHAVMYDLDPEGLEARSVAQKKKKKRGHFTTKGPNFVHSLDGHDKLMGYQNSTYPLAIYGCIDTASRKLLWLRIWVTNSDPLLIGRWYLDYLYETRVIASYLRLDKGSETGVMATMHAFLRRHNGDMDPCDTVIYGPSTSNQIERWWKELHERLEKYFKVHLSWLKEHGHYDSHNDIHRLLVAFVMIPMMQRELDIFKNSVWNCHRIRQQKDTILPAGIPDHIHSSPEEYGLQQCGLPITEEQLQKAAELSGVLSVSEDFLDPAFKRECERLIPNVQEIEAKDCKQAYLYLRDNFSLTS